MSGPPTSLAGDDLIAVWPDGPYHDGLDDSVLTDRTGEILQFRFVEISAWVLRAASDEFNRDRPIGIDGLTGFPHGDRLVHFSDQGCQSPAERRFDTSSLILTPLYEDYAAFRCRSR